MLAIGIPQFDTAEMTGSMAPRERAIVWRNKRVFFLTPQVMQNDLGRGACPSTDVCCIVFDEAHKALGNHAYCQVIIMIPTCMCKYFEIQAFIVFFIQVVKDLANAKSSFRVLALSATPGNDLKVTYNFAVILSIFWYTGCPASCI